MVTIETHGQATVLCIDGQPFFMLAGELGNSSASRREHPEAVFPRLASMNLNTVLVSVTWAPLPAPIGLRTRRRSNASCGDAAQGER